MLSVKRLVLGWCVFVRVGAAREPFPSNRQVVLVLGAASGITCPENISFWLEGRGEAALQPKRCFLGHAIPGEEGVKGKGESGEAFLLPPQPRTNTISSISC